MHLTLSGDANRLLSLLTEMNLCILGLQQDIPAFTNEVHIPLNTPDGATWLYLHFDPNPGDAVIMTLDDESDFEEHHTHAL